MRDNQPVTQREYPLPVGVTLMSTTDTKSHITYANAAFVAVSGFSCDELIGRPHNLVRHPDMPAEAFSDMWATLKAGRSWTALVKNRRKDGDHYWVRANVTPVVRDGQVAGYMSVRTQPTREEVDAAAALYKAFREKRAGNRSFHQGLLIRTGWFGWLSVFQTMPVRWRLRVGVTAGGCAAIGGAVLCGIAGPLLAGFSAGAAVVAVAITAWLEAQIARPLTQIECQALAVAAGQPAENLHLNRVDEIGMILRAVNQSGLNLRSLVDDVSGQVHGLRTTSSEIAQGNNDLSSRTEQTASNLEETASSMEQIASTVKNNAETARTAAEMAAKASEFAVRGGSMVNQVVDTMQTISHASKRIADIIGVIDGIAFQTNILALNAAVEAARAGEQGRGFAVVAGEVRALARRSAEAAKEIKCLIGDSAAKVDDGTVLVDEAGQSMSEIVSQVQRVSELINEISHSTAEQSSGIAQVNVAVTQLEQVTQQNGALVDQSAAAANSLKEKTERLVNAVSVFRT